MTAIRARLRRASILVIAAAALAPGTAVSPAPLEAYQQAPPADSLKLSDLPAPVQTTAQAQIGGAQITRIAFPGKSLYTLDMLVKGKIKQVIIEPSGDLLQVTQHIELDAFPPEVKAAVKRSVPGQARFTRVFRMERKAKTYYGVDAKTDGRMTYLTLDPQGSVVAMQEDLAPDALPAAVRAGIEREARGRTLCKVSAITQKGALIYYVAVLDQDGKTAELRIAPDGQPYVR